MADYLKADLFLKVPFNGSTSFTTQPFEVESYSHIWMYIAYTADADTTSTLGLRFSLDPNALETFPIGVVYPAAAGSYSPEYLGGSVALTTLAASAFNFTGRTAAGSVWFKFQNPPPNLQLVYTRAGGARLFEVSLFGRGA